MGNQEMVLIDVIGIPLPMSYSSRQPLLVIYCVYVCHSCAAFDTQVSYSNLEFDNLERICEVVLSGMGLSQPVIYAKHVFGFLKIPFMAPPF